MNKFRKADGTTHGRTRAIQFFWCLLIGATTVSLMGNVTHAVLPYIPRIAIQAGAAGVPPIALLAAVHGIAVAVRAGASGAIYRWAVGAVAAIGVGAFAVSFMALRDLMRGIGYGVVTACVFPVIIDATVAVSTMMLVALGDKPVRRVRKPVAPAPAHTAAGQPYAPAQVSPPSRTQRLRDGDTASSVNSAPKSPALSEVSAPERCADAVVDHRALAQALVDAGATTKPTDLVLSILSAHEEGKALNRIATELGVHHKTVARILDAALDRRQRFLLAG